VDATLLVVSIVLAACSNASHITDARPVERERRPAAERAGAWPLRERGAASPHALVTFVIDDGALADYTVKSRIHCECPSGVAVAAIILRAQTVLE